jgi:hypothetical protein
MSDLQWPAEGIHVGIEPSVYFASIDPRIVSKSLLWDFYPNPYRWLMGPPKEITEAMRWGSLVDCLALTPLRFEAAYAVQPDTYVSAPADVVLTTAYEGEWNGRTKVCREWRQAQEAEGKRVMTPEEHAKESEPKPWNWNSDTCKEWRRNLPPSLEVVSAETLRRARHAVRMLQNRAQFCAMMDGADCQVGMLYEAGQQLHGQPGMTLRMKGLVDIVPAASGEYGNYLVDLKTTGKLDDVRQIERTIYERGYHAQAALYLDLWNALTGEDRRQFAFVFQQNTEPFEVAIVELDAAALRIGRKWYLRALKLWARCIATNEYPSPWDECQIVGLPAWAKKKEETPNPEEAAA